MMMVCVTWSMVIAQGANPTVALIIKIVYFSFHLLGFYLLFTISSVCSPKNERTHNMIVGHK